jgi:hypothetical protein
MAKTSIDRLTGRTTNDNETVRIRKLLTFANNCFTTNEATAARVIAYNLISDGLQRGVVDFGDFLDLMPADVFDYKRPDQQ